MRIKYTEMKDFKVHKNNKTFLYNGIFNINKFSQIIDKNIFNIFAEGVSNRYVWNQDYRLIYFILCS